MTPEQSRQLTEVYEWMKRREAQMLPYPLDDLSLLSITDRLDALTGTGTSTSSLTDTIDTSGPSATVPKAYNGRIILTYKGVTYHIPTLTVV